MDFTVESLHTTEKKLNSQTGPFIDFLKNLVELFDSNFNMCKAAASSVNELKSKVIDSQNQLIIRQQEDLVSVKDTVQKKMKSWADVVRKSDKQTQQLTAKSVKEVDKAVNEEEERSKNLIVYGLQDDDKADWD
ncbi:hypothetical protein ACHWQZ_G003066 [Mnemiopsis leidyi]